MRDYELSISSKNNTFEQLDALFLPNPLSSSDVTKPEWCVEPRNSFVLANIENGVKVCLNDFHLIGRGEKSDLVIESLFVSRYHAALLHHCSGEFYLIDLASSHGTFIGDERLNPYVPTLVRKGSLIRFGLFKNQYILFGFPSIKEILINADKNPNFCEKITYLNTEMNKRNAVHPFIDTTSLCGVNDGQFDYESFLSKKLNIQISNSPCLSSNSLSSNERQHIRRRNTVDLSDISSTECMEFYNSSPMMIRMEKNVKFADDNLFVECVPNNPNEGNSYQFTCGVEELVKETYSMTNKRKRKRCYPPSSSSNGSDDRHLGDGSFQGDPFLSCDQMLLNRKRVRFTLPVGNTCPESSSASNSSDDGDLEVDLEQRNGV